MGYTTSFEGSVTIDPPLNADEVSFLKDLAETRRMKRTKGPLFVKGTDFFGQGRDADIQEYNFPDSDQPELWLQWVPSEDGTSISWDGGEKFYEADAWMEYIVNNLLSPRAREYVNRHLQEDPRLPSFTFDHAVNGTINAEGEDSADIWRIVVKNNVVTREDAQITWPSAQPRAIVQPVEEVEYVSRSWSIGWR